METPQPLKSDKFRVWLYLMRTVQAIITLVVLGLDISVADEWNQNQLNFNSIASDAAGSQLSLKTWVGGTPFTGIVLFTVSLPAKWT